MSIVDARQSRSYSRSAPPATCPIMLEDDRDCFGTPHPLAPYSICEQHWQVIRVHADNIPPDGTQCGKCLLLTVYGGVCMNPSHDLYVVSRAQEQERRDSRQKVRAANERISVVYYIKFGNRIKIGTTRNLRQRMSNLMHDAIMAIEPGDMKLERKRHEQFAALLAAGREWFSPAPDILAHITITRETYGDPKEYM